MTPLQSVATALLLAVLALPGCKPAGSGKLAPVGQAKVDQAHEQCISSGGDFLREGEGQSFLCVGVPKDAGKSCDSANDCEGDCLARSHTCAPVSPLLGCDEVLTAGGLSVTQCIE